MRKRSRRDDYAEPPALDSDDAALVKRLRRHYVAPAFSRSQQLAFAARLEERLARARRSWKIPIPVASVAAAGLVFAFLVVSRAPEETDGLIAPWVLAANDETSHGHLEAALGVFGLEAEVESEVDESLPDDYEAIGSLFLGS